MDPFTLLGDEWVSSQRSRPGERTFRISLEIEPGQEIWKLRVQANHPLDSQNTAE